MGNISFAAPIQPGKTDAWKAAAEIKGARKSGYEASRRRLGVKSERAFLQQTPMGDVIIVSIEADDTDSFMERMATSADPFDVWFKKTVIEGVHGMDLSSPPPMPELMVEYRA